MSLVDDLLALPVGREVKARDDERDVTAKLEVTGDTMSATLVGEPDTVDDDAARAFLVRKGLNPDEWRATGFRASEWGDGLESKRFTFVRSAASVREMLDIEAIADRVLAQRSSSALPVYTGAPGFLLGLGDMQFGKIDGDGVEGTLARTIGNIDLAFERYMEARDLFGVSHVHIGWLGDHIEGFVSQGGANVWRTRLTLNEQIRLTRRVMLHALTTFAPEVPRLTMAAVPGNHGEPQRFSGKGVTRYDDSHDTESLIAVADAAALNPDAFGHVEFYVPQTDEMTVVVDVAGTRIGQVHGHQWRPGKQWEWWKGQAFGTSLLRDVDVLMAGHLHHFHAEEKGGRLYVGMPALEDESTWWRHATGDEGNPGVWVALTKDGQITRQEVVR